MFTKRPQNTCKGGIAGIAVASCPSAGLVTIRRDLDLKFIKTRMIIFQLDLISSASSRILNVSSATRNELPL